MSSGTRTESDAHSKISRAVSGQVLDPRDTEKIARLGMSPRQQELNRRWSFYCTQQYAARAVDWDGSPRSEGLDAEAIATAGFLPPGFYDAGATFPLKFRRPTAPYHLIRVIVSRFTGLLFSERRAPQIRVQGDHATEEFVQALANQSRLWARMVQARLMGGAMGSVAIGFQFVEGKPVIEIHDPRWTFPTFEDRSTLKLRGIEKRYMYPEEVRDPETGQVVEVNLWYRRIIDEERDILFKPALVTDEEPAWEIAQEVEHGFGFCPVVWVQNSPVEDAVDGEPDCIGIFDLSEAIDALLSQANRGVGANCDPTVHVSTNMSLGEVRKGSDNAIKTEIGGGVAYVEISGSGPKAATELAKEFRALALEVAQCVLEQPQGAGGARTATEIERAFSSMTEKADVFREQYGEHGVKPLLEMMTKASRSSTQPRIENGTIVRGTLSLPPKVVNGSKNGEAAKQAAYQLGPGGVLDLKWPPYFDPSVQDVQAATGAAASAKAAGLIDDEHAVAFIAPYFDVEDPSDMARQLRAGAEEEQAEIDETTFAEEASPEVEAVAGEMGMKFYQYEIEGGVVSINEVRRSKGLPPMIDGELSLPAYRAKHPDMFAASTVTMAATSAEKVLGMDGTEPPDERPLR
jgi:hypothetical protein